MHPQKKTIFPLLSVFIFSNLVVMASKDILAEWSIDFKVLLIANAFFFLLSLVTFFMHRRALDNSNPNVFVRSVMGGMLIKMFATITVVILYRLFAGKGLSRVSVFSSMFLYLLYLGVEVSIITKLNRAKNG